jgi:general secretion pathway protein K
MLTTLFKNWDLPDNDAEALADALAGWMKKEHIYASGLSPSYEQSAIPYEEPRRSLRSFQELAAIDKVRDLFFTDEGRPNELWQRFVNSISLLDFQTTNINGAKSDALAALGQLDATQQRSVSDYIQGAGAFQHQGPRFFNDPAEAQQIAGGAGNLGAFTSTISALRIFVTVQDGRSQYRLAAVVSAPNGAATVQTTATEQKTTAASGSPADPGAKQDAAPERPQVNPPNAGGGPNASGGANDRNLRYPFTLLEIRENDEIASAPVAESTE